MDGVLSSSLNLLSKPTTDLSYFCILCHFPLRAYIYSLSFTKYNVCLLGTDEDNLIPAFADFTDGYEV